MSGLDRFIKRVLGVHIIGVLAAQGSYRFEMLPVVQPL